jgi:hypothetical protein
MPEPLFEKKKKGAGGEEEEKEELGGEGALEATRGGAGVATPPDPTSPSGLQGGRLRKQRRRAAMSPPGLH